MKIDAGEKLVMQDHDFGTFTGETCVCTCGGVAHKINLEYNDASDKVEFGERSLCEGMIERVNDFTIAIKEDKQESFGSFVAMNMFAYYMGGGKQ